MNLSAGIGHFKAPLLTPPFSPNKTRSTLRILVAYRMFSLTWPAYMQIYCSKRKRLHKKRVELPGDWFGTPTWQPFHCFGTPIWPPWRHVKHSILEPLPFQLARSVNAFRECAIIVPVKGPKKPIMNPKSPDLELASWIQKECGFSTNFESIFEPRTKQPQPLRISYLVASGPSLVFLTAQPCSESWIIPRLLMILSHEVYDWSPEDYWLNFRGKVE